MLDTFSSEKLVAIRKLKGYSQEKLAEKAGINIRTLQRLEKNFAQPQPHTLKILADSLEVTIEDFMMVQSDPMPTQMPALMHFLGASGSFIPFGNLIVPFGFWLYRKKQFPELDAHAKAVLNFHLSITLYIFLSLFLFFSVESLGWLVFVTVFLGFMIPIFSIISGLRVLKNKQPTYPFSIHFLK